MKIAVILPSLANRGPILIAKYLTDTWKAQGESIDLFYFDNIEEISFNCPIKRIKFYESIDFSCYDIIHSHMLRPDLYLWWHRRKIPKPTKIITTIHQETYSALSMQYNHRIAWVVTKFWFRALGVMDKIVVLNKTIAIQMGTLAEKSEIIGNGIPRPEMNTTKIAREDEEKIFAFKNEFDLVLGSSSLLINRKGLDQTIRILHQFPNIGYIILGDGPEKENLTSLAKKENVQHQCLFLGQKQNGWRFFPHFDVYMLTSLSEGFPISGIEASLFKLPIVASDIQVLKDVFSEDEVSFYETGNLASLERAIKRAIREREHLGNIVFKKYELELTDKVMADKYLNLFNKLKNV